MRNAFAIVLALFVALPASGAFAACSNPSGAAGDLIYNSDYNAYQYCNNTNWVAAGEINPAAGSGTCSNPTGSERDIIYNTDHSVMQFCNGQDWIAMGSTPVTSSSCGFSGGTCPTSNSSVTGCISGRTLSWGTVSCSTAGDVRSVAINGPLVDGIKTSGNNLNTARFAAIYFCAELGLGWEANTAATLTETSYWQMTPGVSEPTGWFYRSSASDSKNTAITCFENMTAP